MHFRTGPAPHLAPPATVGGIMRQVLYALIPATVAYVWYFGIGLILNMLVATLFALAAEYAMLRARRQPVAPALSDYSAIVMAVLLAFALPPLTPWWVTATGAVFAIVFAKHLYGGLGYNIFNPAMAGYVVLLIAFPKHMTQWLPPANLGFELPRPDTLETLLYTLTGRLPETLSWDAIGMATPLDTVKTELSLNLTVDEIRRSTLFGDFGGRGWEWVNNYIALGGIYLLLRGIIRWHIPVAVLASLIAISTLFFFVDPGSHTPPGFQVFSGAALLGAFFIATDPVSAATSDRGRLIYGAGIGILIYVLRTWGIHPDGVAFAVLLMNLAVPLIDHYTIPRAYGHAR